MYFVRTRNTPEQIRLQKLPQHFSASLQIFLSQSSEGSAVMPEGPGFTRLRKIQSRKNFMHDRAEHRRSRRFDAARLGPFLSLFLAQPRRGHARAAYVGAGEQCFMRAEPFDTLRYQLFNLLAIGRLWIVETHADRLGDTRRSGAALGAVAPRKHRHCFAGVRWIEHALDQVEVMPLLREPRQHEVIARARRS